MKKLTSKQSAELFRAKVIEKFMYDQSIDKKTRIKLRNERNSILSKYNSIDEDSLYKSYHAEMSTYYRNKKRRLGTMDYFNDIDNKYNSDKCFRKGDFINGTIYKVAIDYYLLKEHEEIYKELNTYIINLNITSLNLQEFERYVIENYTKGQKT